LDRAGITLYESQTDSFRFYAVITNMATPALAHDSVIPREGSAVGWVYDNRRLHIREDLQKEQVFMEDRYYVQEGLGRMINLPLLVRIIVSGH
jgi:formate hydrogenlyase transcriptional activator